MLRHLHHNHRQELFFYFLALLVDGNLEFKEIDGEFRNMQNSEKLQFNVGNSLISNKKSYRINILRKNIIYC